MTEAIVWQEAYGQVDGRGYHTVDAFHGPGDITTTTSIDGAYIDGVSVSHGAAGAREHIWTLGGGYASAGQPCPAEGGTAAPSFVGSNYRCVYPSTSPAGWASTSTGTFFHTASGPGTNDIDVRIMLDQDSTDEDAGVDAVQLYVR